MNETELVDEVSQSSDPLERLKLITEFCIGKTGTTFGVKGMGVGLPDCLVVQYIADLNVVLARANIAISMKNL